MRTAIPQLAATFANIRMSLVGMLLISCPILVEAKSFVIPAAPARMLWDKDAVFERAPAKKAELENALIEFRERNNYSVYLIVIDNSIGFDIGESLMFTRQKWLENKDGVLLCVDIGDFRLHLEENPISLDDVSGASYTPRLLREMPAVIRPACNSLADSAKARHINGIPLVEHYTLGMLKVIGDQLHRPASARVPTWAVVSAVVALLLLGLLVFWWIVNANVRLADQRRRENASIYRFPRIALPIRLGGVSGGMISNRQYANGDGRSVVDREAQSNHNRHRG